MANPKIFDGEKTRAMTDAEYEQWQNDIAILQTQIDAFQNKIAARQAVLDKLGLTADEITALFG